MKKRPLALLCCGYEAIYQADIGLKAEMTKAPGQGHHLNDDRSPLLDLFGCIVCKEIMRIEQSAPDAEGNDIVQYRCSRCDRIERVRLFRRSRRA